MYQECHAHIFMDGYDYPAAARRYRNGPVEEDIRRKLAAYQTMQIDYIRDGGDHYGAATLACRLAPEYGIEYRSPAFAIYRSGQYGRIVGKSYDTMKQFHERVQQAGDQGADFIKVMFSGIMDFNHDGAVTGQPRGREEIREMIHIAHEEGFAVMAHVNGDAPIRAAIEAGVDSIEHGYYMSEETLTLLSERQTIWVPTLSTLANLLGSDRFPHALIEKLVREQTLNIQKAMRMGARIAPGSDAGAFCVPHGEGALRERELLLESGAACGESEQETAEKLACTASHLRARFRRK